MKALMCPGCTTAKRSKSPLEYAQVFGNKTATSLQRTTLVALPVHGVVIDVSVSGLLEIMQAQPMLFPYSPLPLERYKEKAASRRM